MFYLTGDIHGTHSIGKLSSKIFKRGKDLTKNDYVGVVGDFGLIWNNEITKEELYWINWYNNKPWTTLFIDGNHENFDRLYSYPEISMFGDKVGKISKSIYHLKRGRIYNIDGNKIFTFGGGLSVDKYFRIEGESWWKQEYPSKKEEDLAIDNLIKHNWNVDYVLTHAAPITFFTKVMSFSNVPYQNQFKYDDKVSRFLENEIFKKITFKKWYFGHYHMDINSDYFRCLYDDVVKIGD